MPYITDLYWKYALFNLVGWLLLFGILLFLGNYLSPDTYSLDP